MEAASVVIAVGPGVTSCKVGDIMTYAGFPVSAYAEEHILPAERAVPFVAALRLNLGIQSFTMQPQQVELDCWCVNRQMHTVIGAVSTKAKAVQAKEDGCHHVIIYKEESHVDRVKEITSGKGVNVAYESIGKDTFLGSIECVKPRGYLVTFGMPSGNQTL
uniref:Alcohol dehydrogenase-like C-terminal domain-containing protein n=1 Tax=Tanacetum cinerariifolium TaxID=118510 RepID=A0A6L2JCN9_TANCI|nr:hypothetical protein [Tanacetum cinerariifolium]